MEKLNNIDISAANNCASIEFETKEAAEKWVASSSDVSSYEGTRLSFWFFGQENTPISYSDLEITNELDHNWLENPPQFSSVQVPEDNYNHFTKNESLKVQNTEYSKTQSDFHNFSPDYHDFCMPYSGKHNFINTLFIFQEIFSTPLFIFYFLF